ncbi:hypothetical protein EGR_10748 [Echinococcus granulosus]|uniref:Uncharacterized protein n=1 Tax=Echinococcus granulosus TaxID=6210 RepID=W6U1I0_ECHGR|nr:hypothetical protein EGR_10748 [Echinococcus granulosus]EUB54391.1 hypothetical protein EGR_10748 [Echinococcus granulosus]
MLTQYDTSSLSQRRLIYLLVAIFFSFIISFVFIYVTPMPI